MTEGLCIVIAIALFALAIVWWNLPYKCGACGATSVRSKGFEIAGEYVALNSWCDSCKRELMVNSAGYLVVGGGFWHRTAIPKHPLEFHQ